MRSDPKTINVTTVLVGSGRCSISFPIVRQWQQNRWLSLLPPRQLHPYGWVLNHFPHLHLIQMNTQTRVHQPTRFG